MSVYVGRSYWTKMQAEELLVGRGLWVCTAQVAGAVWPDEGSRPRLGVFKEREMTSVRLCCVDFCYVVEVAGVDSMTGLGS